MDAGLRERTQMCKSTGFVVTMSGFNAGRQFAVIDNCTGDDADQWIAAFGRGGYTDGYETIELSQDAMDEGRCELLADMDTLMDVEDKAYAVPYYDYNEYGSAYILSAEVEADDAQEELTEMLLSDAKDTGWEYAQQDVTLVGGVRSMWAMRHSGQTIGW